MSRAARQQPCARLAPKAGPEVPWLPACPGRASGGARSQPPTPGTQPGERAQPEPPEYQPTHSSQRPWGCNASASTDGELRHRDVGSCLGHTAGKSTQPGAQVCRASSRPTSDLGFGFGV